MSPPGEKSASARAPLRVLAAAFLFSTGGAAIKAASLTGWQVACFRSGVAVLAVWALLPASRRGWSVRTVFVGAGYAATLICFVLANKLTTSANTIFLQSTAPLYLMLIGPWLLHEPIRRRDLAFMAVLVGGLALFFVGTEAPRATAPDPIRGNVLAAMSGVFWALTVSGIRWMEKRDPGAGAGAAAVAAGNLTAFLVCLAPALPVVSSRPADWAVIAYLGVFQIGLAYVFLTTALRYVPALEASLLLCLEPVLNPMWAWIVHGELPSRLAFLGASLIFSATVARAIVEARRKPS